MPIGELAPSVERRLKAYHALSHKLVGLEERPPRKPTITLSREFGCEAFPIATELVKQAEQKSGTPWLLVDKSLLDAVAREHHVPEDIIRALGKRPVWFDEMLTALAKNWKNDTDYYRLLCEQVMMIASAGNAVIVGLGAAFITRNLDNCFHYRLVADHKFKVHSISRRLKIPKQDAEIIVLDQQKERDRIIRRLLDVDLKDPLLYHAIFNNGKARSPQIARTILDHTLACCD